MAVILSALAGAYILIGPVADHLMGRKKEMERSFADLRIGMTRSEVLSAMGQPDEQSKAFYLGQREGFEEEYRRAAESGAVDFLVWRSGVDILCSAGFDARDQLVVRECGGT